MQQAIKATFNAVPRLSTSAIRCDNVVAPSYRAALTSLSAADLAAHVVVPVKSRHRTTTLWQEISPNWDRLLVTNADLGPPQFCAPILLSARNRWHLNEGTVEAFDRAVVIDGAKRLEASFQFNGFPAIPVMIVWGLQSDGELALRRQALTAGESIRVEIRDRIGTAAPRLTIDDAVVCFEIQSDPFVVPTSRGYSPAVLVRRRNMSFSEHVLIGARSLATELESLRCRYGTLIGLHVSIRKEGPEKTSPYVLRAIEHPKANEQ